MEGVESAVVLAADATNLTTMIATGVVAAAAIASLIMNGRAGYHARQSAQAAEHAAEAARDAAAATRAAVEVDFQIDGLVGGGQGSIRVESKGASVWVHEVRLTSLWDASGFNLRDDPCPFARPDQPPVFVHRGNAFICAWPNPLPEVHFSAWLDVTYSFERDLRRFTVGRMAKGDVIVPAE